MLRIFFVGMVRNFVTVFRGRNLLWHALAVGLTGLLVVSGADWSFYEYTRIEALYPLVWVAGLGGFFVPVVVPAALYIIAELRHNALGMATAAAIAQAELIVSLIVAVYKAFTGRIQPDFIYSVATADISRDFQFGFLRHGIFWGWPSSHAAVAFAGAVALALMLRSRVALTLGLIYAALISLGAAIGFHWLSDVVAGGIIGSLVGVVVARGRSGAVTIEGI